MGRAARREWSSRIDGASAARLVRAAGFVVRIFASAEEFLESDRSMPLRCMVLDVCLAGMDGFQLHERLRALGGTQPPVIFITAHDDVANRERARRAGALHYLRKPFDDAALIDAIRRADCASPA